MSNVYDEALAYDVAFSFRDVPAECDALTAFAARHGCGARSFLELACGPGEHVLEMAGRGVDAVGLDLSAAMCAHLEKRAYDRGVKARAVRADMREFELGRRFHVAACLMDSSSHLLSNDDLLRHLRAVAAHLEPGGVYVLECAHPSNHFGTRRTTSTDWTIERDGLRVHATWGHPGDAFDALTEIEQTSVVLEVDRPDGTRERIEGTMPIRKITRGCLEAVVELSGVFDVAAWYGSVDENVPADDPERAWRMVPILRRRG